MYLAPRLFFDPWLDKALSPLVSKCNCMQTGSGNARTSVAHLGGQARLLWLANAQCCLTGDNELVGSGVSPTVQLASCQRRQVLFYSGGTTILFYFLACRAVRGRRNQPGNGSLDLESQSKGPNATVARRGKNKKSAACTVGAATRTLEVAGWLAGCQCLFNATGLTSERSKEREEKVGDGTLFENLDVLRAISYYEAAGQERRVLRLPPPISTSTTQNSRCNPYTITTRLISSHSLAGDIYTMT